MEQIVEDEKSATLIYSVLANNWISTNLVTGCKLKVKYTSQDKTSIAFGLSRSFAYSAAIDHQINKLRESGVISKIEDKWFNTPELDPDSICMAAGLKNQGTEVALGLDSAKFFFYFLTAGIAGAIVALVAEKIVKKNFWKVKAKLRKL